MQGVTKLVFEISLDSHQNKFNLILVLYMQEETKLIWAVFRLRPKSIRYGRV